MDGTNAQLRTLQLIQVLYDVFKKLNLKTLLAVNPFQYLEYLLLRLRKVVGKYAIPQMDVHLLRITAQLFAMLQASIDPLQIEHKLFQDLWQVIIVGDARIIFVCGVLEFGQAHVKDARLADHVQIVMGGFEASLLWWGRLVAAAPQSERHGLLRTTKDYNVMVEPLHPLFQLVIV